MSRRPTAAVYRRRRLVVGLGAAAVVVLVVWLASVAASALVGSHSDAAGIASASASASAEADNSPSISVAAIPIGGKCDAGDIVVRPVPAQAHVNGDVALSFDVFTKQNPVCVWLVTHSSVQVTISTTGTPSFWSTSSCPSAVKAQTVTLHQGSPTRLTLAVWNGQSSSQAAGCGPQGTWAVPGAYAVYAAALGGNPSVAALTMVAPGVPLVQPSAAATVTPTTTTGPSASTTPTAGVKPKPAPKASASTTTAPAASASPSSTTW